MSFLFQFFGLNLDKHTHIHIGYERKLFHIFTKKKCFMTHLSALIHIKVFSNIYIYFHIVYNNCTVTHTTIGGFYGLLEDTLALLPQDEIFILFFEKLDSSVEFANFVESIGSPEFGKRFDALKVC